MVERCNERFFDLPLTDYFGVLIREAAAKKLQKILLRHTQEIKDFLIQNMDALESSNWTLAYTPSQTVVYYYDRYSKEDLKCRISLIDKTDLLSFVSDVFRTDKAYDEAMDEVEAFYEEHYSEGNEGHDLNEISEAEDRC